MEPSGPLATSPSTTISSSCEESSGRRGSNASWSSPSSTEASRSPAATDPRDRIPVASWTDRNGTRTRNDRSRAHRANTDNATCTARGRARRGIRCSRDHTWPTAAAKVSVTTRSVRGSGTGSGSGPPASPQKVPNSSGTLRIRPNAFGWDARTVVQAASRVQPARTMWSRTARSTSNASHRRYG